MENYLFISTANKGFIGVKLNDFDILVNEVNFFDNFIKEPKEKQESIARKLLLSEMDNYKNFYALSNENDIKNILKKDENAFIYDNDRNSLFLLNDDYQEKQFIDNHILTAFKEKISKILNKENLFKDFNLNKGEQNGNDGFELGRVEIGKVELRRSGSYQNADNRNEREIQIGQRDRIKFADLFGKLQSFNRFGEYKNNLNENDRKDFILFTKLLLKQGLQQLKNTVEFLNTYKSNDELKIRLLEIKKSLIISKIFMCSEAKIRKEGDKYINDGCDYKIFAGKLKKL